MHRHDAHCHWCGERGRTVSIPSSVWRSAAALVLAAGMGAAVWQYAPTIRDFGDAIARDVERVRATDDADRARQVADRLRSMEETTGQETLPASDAALSAPVLTDSTTMAVADGALVADYAAEGSIQWTPAVARTWVNVRSDASRGGEVVGVIKPASRAMLGTDRFGWRQVRSTDVSGWVDPKLFEADSLRTRGE